MFDTIKSIGREDKKHTSVMALLNRVEHKIERYVEMSFPDVTSFDFQLVKNEWKSLPNEISSGVKVMGLHIDEDYRSMLVHYNINAYIDQHYHSKEIEVIRLISGKLLDKVNNTYYQENDLITIDKGDLHNIVSVGEEEAYMIIVFSESERVIEKLFNRDYL